MYITRGLVICYDWPFDINEYIVCLIFDQQWTMVRQLRLTTYSVHATTAGGCLDNQVINMKGHKIEYDIIFKENKQYLRYLL